MSEVWTGHEAFRPHLMPIADLTPDPTNARKHPERNLETIKKSLERFGQVLPILHRGGQIVAGHGRAQAASLLGWTHLAALDVDTLSEEEARALALIDNKSSELAEWDLTMLGKIMDELPPELQDFTGFAKFEREALLQPAKPGPAMVSIEVTKEQHVVIEAAVKKLREGEGDEAIKVGRALELICADWLS
jgi:hypothetical protein